MRTRRREIEGLSLSFLDVISCGFGALILLLVLTKVFEPVVLEGTVSDLEQYLQELEQELQDIRQASRAVTRELIRTEDTRTETQEEVARMETNLDALEKEHSGELEEHQARSLLESKLKVAKQELSDEMEALLANQEQREVNDSIGGIPVDSEYVIFIIDTSGSMFTYAWPLVLEKVSETLAVYPQLKGIQVMNDMGNYMFSQYTDDWLPDTEARRRGIIDRLETWNVFSNSSPVEGITKAISTYYRTGRKISLYVFGDDFTGRSIQNVIDTVDRINRKDATGERRVRIHAVGFPVYYSRVANNPQAAIRFAILMRALAERNGGTFVGLNDHRAY